jgi:hypothetical protein
MIAIAGVIGVAAAVGLILATTGGDRPETTAEEPPPTSLSAPDPEAPTPPEAETTTPVAAVAPSDDTAEEEGSEPDAVGVGAAMMRRARRGMSGTTTTEAMGGGVPMWDWQ